MRRRSIMAEPMWVDVGYICAAPEHGQQIADAAVGVRPASSTEDWPLDDPGRTPLSASRTGVFSGTVRALSPFPFLIAAFPERG